MQIEAIKSNQNKTKNRDSNINKTLKGVLINNHVKNQEPNSVSFDEIHDSLLICDKPKSYNDKNPDENKQNKDETFNVKRALKPLLIGTGILVGGTFALSAIVKNSSKRLLNTKSFEQLPDLAVNMNIKEEPQFAIYRAIRDPNFKNMLGACAVILMTGITIGCKNFVDGAKEIWIKKQNADIEKNLQENLIAVETSAFSGKLQFVNDLMQDNVKFFDKILNSKKEVHTTPNIFKGFPSFRGEGTQNDEKETKNPILSKNMRYMIMGAGVLLGAVLLGKLTFDNFKKTIKYTQDFANGYTENTIDAIKNISGRQNPDDIPKVTELLKSVCAKPEFVREVGSKYNLGEEQISGIIQEVDKTKKTIFADAPLALGGIPKKIQYYCYIDENRGHLYNWVLNPENKFTKYIFGAFTLSSAIGYLFKQGMDAIKEVTVLKENAKTELNLRKRLVDVEVRNFKSKKESAIKPLIENFEKDVKSGEKTKEELKQLADNILTETKNGPPYVYT